MEEMTVDFSIKENEKIEATFEVNTQGTRDHEKLINRDKENQHPISSIVGLQEALDKTFFPTTIDNSGASAPSSQPQTLGEKYLDTTNKKIYIVEEGWSLKSNVINTATFNGNDGSVTGFDVDKGIYQLRNDFLDWVENVDFKMKFKLNQEINSSNIYTLFYSMCQISSLPSRGYYVTISIRYGFLHLSVRSVLGGSSISANNDYICDTQLQPNIDYYLELKKSGTSLNIILSNNGYGQTIIEENIISTQNNSVVGTPSDYGISYGCSLVKPNPYSDYSVYGTNLFTIGTIFLTDSYGDFVEKSSSSLVWKSYDLKEESVFLDTLNNILYFYKDDKLTPIGV